MRGYIKAYIDIFIVLHVNAFYSIGYFLKTTLSYLYCLQSHLVYQELWLSPSNYVDDERRII